MDPIKFGADLFAKAKEMQTKTVRVCDVIVKIDEELSTMPEPFKMDFMYLVTRAVDKCENTNNNYPRDLSAFRFNDPAQVELEGDGYADGQIVYDWGKCPKCGWEFENGDKDWEEPYCCHCGQKLRWFENAGGEE